MTLRRFDAGHDHPDGARDKGICASHIHSIFRHGESIGVLAGFCQADRIALVGGRLQGIQHAPAVRIEGQGDKLIGVCSAAVSSQNLPVRFGDPDGVRTPYFHPIFRSKFRRHVGAGHDKAEGVISQVLKLHRVARSVFYGYRCQNGIIGCGDKLDRDSFAGIRTVCTQHKIAFRRRSHDFSGSDRIDWLRRNCHAAHRLGIAVGVGKTVAVANAADHAALGHEDLVAIVNLNSAGSRNRITVAAGNLHLGDARAKNDLAGALRFYRNAVGGGNAAGPAGKDHLTGQNAAGFPAELQILRVHGHRAASGENAVISHKAGGQHTGARKRKVHFGINERHIMLFGVLKRIIAVDCQGIRFRVKREHAVIPDIRGVRGRHPRIPHPEVIPLREAGKHLHVCVRHGEAVVGNGQAASVIHPLHRQAGKIVALVRRDNKLRGVACADRGLGF